MRLYYRLERVLVDMTRSEHEQANSKHFFNVKKIVFSLTLLQFALNLVVQPFNTNVRTYVAGEVANQDILGPVHLRQQEKDSENLQPCMTSVADTGCLSWMFILDVYPGSRIRLFSIPDPGSESFPSRIPDPHQRI